MAKLSNKEIAQAIYVATKGKKGKELSETLKSTAQFLFRKRLSSRIPEILLALKKKINEDEGIVEAKVRSQRRMVGENRKHLIREIKKRYGAKEVILEDHLDERLLGGVVVEVDDEIIDLSLKNKIRQLQDHLIRKI